MKTLLLAGAAILGIAGAADAAQIAAFSQTSGSNTITATQNGGATATSIAAAAAGVNVSQLFGNPAPFLADFALSANSIDAAQTVLGLAVQHFSGTFCISSGVGCTGTDFLSGSFTDAAVGAVGGPGLVVNVNNPPDTLSLSSSVISPLDLGPPNTFNLAFSNLIPDLAVCGATLCSFTASFSGVASANTTSVPASEPLGLAVLGVGLLGLGLVKARGR
ncbi:MAG TPA: hypothetical protein VGH84_13420 [Steroidobacteraceae bacterium]